MKKKIAVICFNLGGPDALDAVKPFLFNIFNDKSIISLPQPFRYVLAKIISFKRTKTAQAIYGHIGGKSPLLDLTKEQTSALELLLNKEDAHAEYKTFIAMRYWRPLTERATEQVKEWGADEVVLLPLYPQFSTTTSGSSFKEWKQQARKKGLTVPTHIVGCYPLDKEFITAHVAQIKTSISQVKGETYRLLFSAHGLPKKIVDAGDPYPWQIEQTTKAVMEVLNETLTQPLDHVVCYQSRVGPLQWIGPSTEDEIKRAAADGVSIVLIPIAFVSEHSETLVELDIEYRALAKKCGTKEYIRVAALGTQENFIKSLKNMTIMASKEEEIISCSGKRVCPKKFSKCICYYDKS